MKLILKPHPSCTIRGDMIDIYKEDDPMPWACVPNDMFFWKHNEALFEALYRRMETVTVELTIVEGAA